MELYCVLYDCKSKPGAAHLAGASFIYTVEPFEQTWQLLFFYSVTVILETDPAHMAVVLH